jgi:DNA repair protein RadC
MEKVERSETLCEVQVSYKNNVKAADRKKITSSKDAYSILQAIYNPDKVEHVEEMFLLFLNRGNHVLGWAKISSGGTSGTVVDVKLVYQLALGANASALVFSHNHPSGSVKPSDADVKLTKKMQQAGLLLDILVVDHIIYAPDAYYSFSDEGMI